MNVKIGIAPDSWGVIHSNDEKQPPAERVMREMHEAGYNGLELGPWGYFPNDYERLKNELEKNQMELIAGTIHISPLDSVSMEERWKVIDQMSSLLVKFSSAKYIVLLTNVNEAICPLNDGDWNNFCVMLDRVSDYLKEKYNLIGTYHSYSRGGATPTENLLEKFLEDSHTDLCLDTGHFALTNKDVAQFYERYYSRIPYIHFKDASEKIVDLINDNHWTLQESIKKGLFTPGKAMVEPGNGEGCVNFAEIAEVMKKNNFDGWVTVEQDMYPVVSFDDPFPIAQRTYQYVRNLFKL